MIIKDNSCGVLAIDWSLANYSPCTRPGLQSNWVAKTVLNSELPETFISTTYVFITSSVKSVTSGNGASDRNRYGISTLFNFINEIITHDFNPTIIILLADELHALSMQAESTRTLDEIRAMCHHTSQEYTRSFPHPQKLTRPYHLSFWEDWKSGKHAQGFEEILATLRNKIAEHPVFEAELRRATTHLVDKYLIPYKTRLTERAATTQIPLKEQEKLERKRVTPFFVDFALEQMAVIQLIAEKMGPCNILFPQAPPLSLYTLRDFWSALSNHPTTINWPPFQIFETGFQATVRLPGGPVRLRRLVNEIGVKLIITEGTIYLSIPVEAPPQPRSLSTVFLAPTSQGLPSIQRLSPTINPQPWALYLQILAEQLCYRRTPLARKKLILKIIEIHHRSYQLFKNPALPHYMTPLPIFTPYRVQASPDAHNHDNLCSSTYVFVFSIVDALLTDRGYHSVECIKATVNFINDLVAADTHAKVIILLADELQALNAQVDSPLTLDELRQACHNKGASWLSRCKLYFDKIHGGYTLYHWGEWIGGLHQQRFQEIVQSYHRKLVKYPSFDRASHQTYTPYLDNYLRKTHRFLSPEDEQRERTRITPFFASYPLEETAVIQLIIETLGPINLFYPKTLNPTLYYLRDSWSSFTGSTPNHQRPPFQDFQVPCVPRKTLTELPKPAPTAGNHEAFPFTFNHHRLFQALPLNCPPGQPLAETIRKNADSPDNTPLAAEPPSPRHPLIWLFSLGSIVKTLYDPSVTDEQKHDIVNSLQKCYHPAENGDESYWWPPSHK
jgi:hypothetical protein